MKVFKLDSFCKFARKEHVSDSDLLIALNAILRGNADANLGSFLYKQRVAGMGKELPAGTGLFYACELKTKLFSFMAFRNQSAAILMTGNCWL